MITDARVLDVEEFVPSEILHRHAEIETLSGALDPLLHGQRGQHSFLFGPSGAGKTCTARYTVQELERELLNLRTKYVNCWRHHSEFRFLYQLLDGIGAALDVQQRVTPHDEMLQRLESHDESPYVVVLDEVDQLDEPSLLYDLAGMEHVHMILIANREDEFWNNLDERLVSRLRGGRTIRMEGYTSTELVDILWGRIDAALRAGTVSEEVVEYIGDLAAGDARAAIGILRESAQLARERDLGEITLDLVDEAEPTARESIRQKTLSNLTRHQRVVYEIVEEEGEVTPGDLYAEYGQRVTNPKSKRTMRRYMKKMEQYNLVAIVGEKRGRQYQLAR